MTGSSRVAASSDFETMSVIGFAHGVSHFFHLLLPPLFPWLMADFGLSFARIGVTMTVFFTVSGIGQALAGFLVDRLGAFRVLGAGIACFVAASLLLYVADGYAALLGVAALAGLGNSVFHPADFSVLNHRVSQPRLGHAFAVHGLSGNLGWALAPVLLTGVAAVAGWRLAALAGGMVAVLALILLMLRRHALASAHEEAAGKPRGADGPAFAFLGLPAVWLCFLFFFFVTSAFGVIQSFGSPILQALYGLTLGTGATAVSAYLLGGAAGIIVGGFLAKGGSHDRIIAAALAAAAGSAVFLAGGWPPAWAVVPLMAATGFCSGIAGPSRDLLVRRAATARFGQAAYGRIYGFVYSGLDAGLAVAPAVFGGLMDARRFGEVLVGVALLQGVAVLTALRVGKTV